MEDVKNRPFRVLYSFPLRLGVPGIGTTAMMQIIALSSLGMELSVFCASQEKPFRRRTHVVETLRVLGFRIPIRLLGQGICTRLHDIRVAGYLVMQARRSKHGLRLVVHGWPRGSELTFRVARRLGVASVLERQNTHLVFARKRILHEYQRLGLAVPSPRFWHSRNGLFRRELREYSLASGLLCPSEFVRNSFLRLGFNPIRLCRHSYGFDPEVFGDKRSLSQNGVFQVVFVGKGEPRKGLHYALEAWTSSEASTHGVFLILGGIDPEYRRYLSAWLMHDSVRELGFVENVPRYLMESDALILSSVEEGSALVTYEAMGAGCALLVSDSTGAPVTHGKTALIHKVGDVQQLREHINTLFHDRRKLADLKQAAKEASQQYTWLEAAKRLAHSYTMVGAWFER